MLKNVEYIYNKGDVKMEKDEMSNVASTTDVQTNDQSMPEATSVQTEPVVVQPANPVLETSPQLTPATSASTANGGSTTTAAPKKKKTGLIIGIVLAVVALFIIIGVIVLINLSKMLGIDPTGRPDTLSKVYINNIINKKYDDAYKYVYIVDDKFITKNDYLEYVQTVEKYSDVSNKKVVNLEEKLKTEKDANYRIEIVSEDGLKNYVDVKLSKIDNNWKVIEDGFYITNWEFVTLKDAKVTIDGVEVPKSLIKDDTSIKQFQCKYSIPAITSTQKKIAFETKIGKNEETVTPLESNSGTVYGIYLTDDDIVTRAREYIKTTWNSMYQDYLNNVEVSTIKEKYFDSSTDINVVSKAYNDGFKSLIGHNNKNHTILEVVPWEEKQNYVYGDDLIGLNFGYKMSWNWQYSTVSSSYTMTRHSSIMLKIDGDSFKINSVTDDKLFSYANQYTKNY